MSAADTPAKLEGVLVATGARYVKVPDSVLGAAERDLRDLMDHLRYSPGSLARDDSRALVCTPFNGHYGVAGWVLVVQGSPPHGVIVALTRYGGFVKASWVHPSDGRTRRLGDAQQRVVERFLALLPAKWEEN